ncbi:MAG: EthD domain-containing protein [Acidimicrobiales bacterium]
MRKLVLLLVGHPGRGPDEVECAVGQYVEGLADEASAVGLSLRVGSPLHPDPLRVAAETTGRSVTPVDALVEVSACDDWADAALISLVTGSGEALHGVVDATKSAVVLGSVRLVTERGPAPIQLALAAQRLGSLTQVAFHDYWLHAHAPLALALMPEGAREQIGYRQLHASAEATGRAAEATGVAVSRYDGLLQVEMSDPEDFLSFAAEPTFAQRIYEDEHNFADQSEMRGGFLRMRALTDDSRQ